MDSTTLTVASGLIALAALFKPIYVHYIRKDVSVNPIDKPVLAKLRKPIHASHRGGSRIWPENTMLAFRNAVEWMDENGVKRHTQMIEFDIQLTLDKQLVVMHNLSVDETTDGSGLVSSLTLEQIRNLDAGYKFSSDGGITFPFRGTGLKVPTLLEVLNEFVPKLDLVFYLDFKQPGAVGPTMELVKEFGIEERVICGAVPPKANKEVLKLKPACAPATPDINSMILMFVFHKLGLLWMLPMKHEIVGTTVYRWGIRVLNERMVREFHKRNRLMAVFGDYIDSKEGQLDCISLGCDLLVTDRPDVLHLALDQWNEK